MDFKTADLCDHFSETVQIGEEPFGDFGGRAPFRGVIETIKAFEDNSLVREAVGGPGAGKVLVVDGGGSMRRAMLGDEPGHYLYADEDGFIVSEMPLEMPDA